MSTRQELQAELDALNELFASDKRRLQREIQEAINTVIARKYALRMRYNQYTKASEALQRRINEIYD